jgi:hypothetical protein
LPQAALGRSAGVDDDRLTRDRRGAIARGLVPDLRASIARSVATTSAGIAAVMSVAT